MKPEELDLVETEDLVDALHRRCTASIVMGVRKGKTPKASDEILITFGGGMNQIAGLMFEADCRLRIDMNQRLMGMAIEQAAADMKRRLDEESKGE